MTVANPTPRKSTAASDAAIAERCAKVRIDLALREPFWGMLILGCEWIMTRRVATAATDGVRCYLNPDFCAGLTTPELAGLHAHEVMHKMLFHITRARCLADQKVANVAADYVGNEILIDAAFTLPGGALVDRQLTAQGGGTMEGVYRLLMKRKRPEPDKGDDKGDPKPGKGKGDCQGEPGKGEPGEPGKGKGEPGKPGKPADPAKGQPDKPGEVGDDGIPAPMDEMLEPVDDNGDPLDADEMARVESEWKEQVAVAAQSAKRRGKLPAGLERVIDEAIKGKVRWQDVLARFLTRARVDTRTWARPSRRYISQGIYLPSTTGQRLGEIVVFVDCSGSVDKAMLDRFTGELRALHSGLRPEKLHVVSFDSRVQAHTEIDPDGEVNPAYKGGGGTAFSPLWKWVENHGVVPVAAVVLTDLICSDFGAEPDYPVLWVSTHQTTAPWGEVVRAT
jgi:predicted metal-dependent peptidase